MEPDKKEEYGCPFEIKGEWSASGSVRPTGAGSNSGRAKFKIGTGSETFSFYDTSDSGRGTLNGSFTFPDEEGEKVDIGYAEVWTTAKTSGSTTVRVWGSGNMTISVTLK